MGPGDGPRNAFGRAWNTGRPCESESLITMLVLTGKRRAQNVQNHEASHFRS